MTCQRWSRPPKKAQGRRKRNPAASHPRENQPGTCGSGDGGEHGEISSGQKYSIFCPITIAVWPQFEEVGEIMRTVWRDHIDDEYYYLGILLLEKLERIRPSPLLAGKAATWAAGVLFSFGTINFLYDKLSEPYISKADLAECCGVKLSTANGKSRQIRDMFE